MTDAIAPTSETWDAETGSFTYDANGNLLTTPAPYALTAASYDPWNRLLSVTKGAVVTTYRATASGHRLAQRTGSGTTEVTLREGATVLGSMTVDAAGTPTAWHFNLLAGTQAVGRQPSAGSRRYYHTDLLGSVRAVVTGTTVVESTDYDPWGVVLAGRTLSSGTKEGFTGQPRDLATGLDDFGARTYLSAFGRWGSVDELAAKHPEWAAYAYVLDDPNTLIDPDGRQESANRNPNGARMVGPVLRPRPGMWAGAAARGLAGVATPVLSVAPGTSTVADATAVAFGRTLDGTDLTAADRALSLVGLLTPLSGSMLRAGDAAQSLARGGADVVRVGQVGEAAVRGVAAIGPKVAIDIAGRARIPDGLTGTVLTEVKNVGSLSYTQQLRDFAAHASANGLRFDLWVRPSTTLSEPLKQAVANGTINLRVIP